MYRSIRNLLFAGLTVAAMSLAAPQESQANDRYWNNYWNWYDNDYSRYYNRRHRRDYRYPRRDYYRDYRYQGYRSPYYSPYYYGYGGYNWRHSMRAPHNSLDLGPVHLDWR